MKTGVKVVHRSKCCYRNQILGRFCLSAELAWHAEGHGVRHNILTRRNGRMGTVEAVSCCDNAFHFMGEFERFRRQQSSKSIFRYSAHDVIEDERPITQRLSSAFICSHSLSRTIFEVDVAGSQRSMLRASVSITRYALSSSNVYMYSLTCRAFEIGEDFDARCGMRRRSFHFLPCLAALMNAGLIFLKWEYMLSLFLIVIAVPRENPSITLQANSKKFFMAKGDDLGIKVLSV